MTNVNQKKKMAKTNPFKIDMNDFYEFINSDIFNTI